MRLIGLVSVLVAVLCGLSGLSHSSTPSLDQEGSGASGYFSSGDIEHSSGSGFIIDPEPGPGKENECVVATNSVSNASYGLHEKGDVILQARCRSMCIKKILENETLTFLESIIDLEESYVVVSGQSLYENCHIYQKVYECIAGCTMGELDRSSCSSNCFDRCNEDSPGSLPDSSCPLNCSKQQCDTGCYLYDSLTDTTQGPVPSLPSSYSFTVSPYSTPYYHMSGAYQITFDGNWTTPDTSASITSFIVQVSIDNDTLLYLMPSFDSLLLVDPSFGCKDAVFQFLPINEYGPAASYLQYNSNVSIYGKVFPLWPDHPSSDLVTFTIADDERSGYWGHAVVNMSWEFPNRVEYLKTFTIQVSSPDYQRCGKNVTITNIPDLFYTWKAEVPGDGPISDCEYHIYVLSNPHNSTFPGIPDPVRVFINKTTNPVPDGFIAPVDITCSIKKPMGQFIYYLPTIEWLLPSNPLLTQGLQSFTLSLSTVVKDNEIQLKKGISVPYDGLSYKNSITIETNGSYEELIHNLTVVYKDDFNGTRHLNVSHTCTFHLTPPPRVTVLNVNDIFIDSNTKNLHVDINWDSVMFAGTSVSRYNIYVGRSLQHHASLSNPMNGVRYLTTSGLSFHQTINLTKALGHYSPNERIYVQVQPVSFIGKMGVWSEPYVFNPLESKFQANLDVSCGRITQNLGSTATFQSITMRIDWSTASLQVTGLARFIVTLSKIKPDGSSTTVFSVEEEYKDTKTDYAISHNEYYFGTGLYDHYAFEVESDFKNGFPNRGALTVQGCVLDGAPEPPTNIKSISYDHFTIDSFGQLNISLEWSEPEETYSGIREYWVYIGTISLSGNMKPNDSLIVFRTIQSKNLEESDIFIGKALAVEFNNSTDWYFYIQVLAVNNVGGRSNWTSPLLIEMEAVMLDPSIFATSSSVATPQSATPTTSATPIPEDNKKESVPAVDPYRRLVPVLSSIIPLMFIFALAIVVVSILLIVAYCQRRKMSNKSKGTLQIGLGKALNHPGYMWERYSSDLDKLSSIGEGSFGEVYQGTLHQVLDLELGKKYSDDSTAVFAASLKVSCSDDDRKKFMNRVEKYKALAALEHPFFLAFEGCVVSSEPHYLLTEFVENGDLLSFLQNHRKRLMDDQLKSISTPHNLSSHFHQHPTTDLLYPMDLLNYARQISSAMDCLAGLHIVHGDLACRNIYLDQSYNVKVADFGIVANGHREVIYMNGLPIRWLAPEVLTDHAYSTASDVWAFGVTVWEIVTLGNFPYQDIHNNGLLEALNTGERLPIPANCTSKFYDVISPCWEANPHQRPSFESLHETFLDLLSQSEASSLITLDLSVPDKQALETSVLNGSQSPTSIDSAISNEVDLGVIISKKGKLVSVANPGFDTNPPSGFTSTTIKGHHGGFVNPGFRRSSMKSVDLDAPKIQLTQVRSHSPTKPHPSPIKHHPSPTKEHTPISSINSHSSVPISMVETTEGIQDTATEV